MAPTALYIILLRYEHLKSFYSPFLHISITQSITPFNRTIAEAAPRALGTALLTAFVCRSCARRATRWPVESVSLTSIL